MSLDRLSAAAPWDHYLPFVFSPTHLAMLDHLPLAGNLAGKALVFLFIFSYVGWGGMSSRSHCLFTDLYIYLLSFTIVYSKYSLLLCLVPYA